MSTAAVDLAAVEDYPYVGIASYARGLLGAFAAVPEARDWDWVVVAGAAQDLRDWRLPPGARVLRLPARRQGKASALWSHQLVLPRLLAAARVDVYHAPGISQQPSQPAPPLGPLRRTRRVVTIHDLIPWRFPELFGRGAGALVRRAFYRVQVARLARAAWIIADSRATADDLRSRAGVDARRLAVIPPAPGDVRPGAPVDARLAGRRFILHVGSGHAHKNVPALLKAYALLRAAPGVTGGPRLALAGSYPGLAALAAGCCPAYAGDVVELGHVSGAALAGLYRAASVFVFPSRYEGFGLPPLEAMAYGCPVVCSNAGALPEVTGAAALLCAPDDAAGLAEAVRRVLSEPGLAETLRERGYAQAARFDWRETARRTLAVYAAAGKD